MSQVDGSIRIGTDIETRQAEKELKQLEGSIKKSASEISRLQKEMENVKTPTKQYESFQHAINTSKIELESLVAEQEKLFSKGIGKGLDKEYLAASEAVKRLKYDLQDAIESGDKDAYLGIEDRLNRAKSILQEMMSKNPRPLGDISYYYSIDKKIEDLKSNISSTESEMKKLEESGKAFTLGEGAEEKATKIKELTEQMAADTQRQSELQSALAAEEQRLAGIKANATVSDQQILGLLERRRQLLQEIAELEKAGVGLGYREYEDKSRELEEIKERIKEYGNSLSKIPEKYEKMRKSAKKAFDAATGGAEKSSKAFSAFTSRLKGIALSLLIFNWISKGFNAMISGMKKGFENLAGYSDSYAQSIQGMKNAMSTLGNQFAAAFAPIVQMAIPWLNSLVGALSDAMSHVAQFIAALARKSTFTKAVQIQDKYNKSLGGTAKAADKARGALARFDDLDVLEKQPDASGDGADSETLPEDMFEEVQVNEEIFGWLDGVKERIGGVIERLNELKGIFLEGFWGGIGDWGSQWDSIKSSAASIKDSLIEIWSDPAVLSAQEGFYKSLVHMLGSVAGAVMGIGLTIGTNLTGGISLYLDENKDFLKEKLVSLFDIAGDISLLLGEAFGSIAYIFEAFGSENGQQLTEGLIGIFTGAVMGTLEAIGKLARDILNVFIQPFTENKEGFRTALEGFLGTLSEVAGTIKDGVDDTFSKISEVYDEHFKPFFDSVAQGLSDLLGSFLEFWNGNVQPILDEWAALFDEVWKEHVQPMLDNLIELFGTVADALKALWEETFKPAVDWIIQYVMPIVAKVIDAIGKYLFKLFGVVSDVVGGIIKAFGGIITFLAGIFTRDWGKAWDGVKQIFIGIWEAIKSAFKDTINSVIDFTEFLVNGFIKGINAIINMLEEVATIKNPLNGKVIWSLDLPEIPSISIPRLATGAVIRGGNPFMAILGDQPAGQTNVEAPLDTIRQAAREAVREELSRINPGSASRQAKVILNVNGTDLGEAILDDLFSVMDRRGYDVEVLGVR